MDIQEKVIEIICDVLGQEPENVKLDSDIRNDLDGDSIDFADVVMSLEEELDIEIPEEDLKDVKLVGDLVDYLKGKTA
ncbi:MAG: acyl carrier protein [Mycoplasmatales bacterium]